MKKLLLFLAILVCGASFAQNNVIKYTAPKKLVEASSTYGSGIHPKAFNVPVTSHTFSNGQGVITFAGDVTAIDENAFHSCEEMTSITLPRSVTSIGEDAFTSCKKLSSLVIYKSVQSIKGNPFKYCKNLRSIIVEDGNPVYDSRQNCNAIIETATNKLVAVCQTTIIPYGIKCIGNSAFAGSPMQSVSIPSSVTTLEMAAFIASDLTSVSLPYGITSIPSVAFYMCSKLSSVSIPSSVTKIDYAAFSECTSLAKIVIPSSVTNIHHSNFDQCDNLSSIVVERGNPTYDSRQNCNAIIETATNKLLIGCRSTVIPDNISKIGEGAFWCCHTLSAITIPFGVIDIGEKAFYGCNNLRSLVVDKRNTVYDSRQNCNAIIKTSTNTLLFGCMATTIPTSVKHIGQEAFAGIKNLSSITLPNSIETIGKYAFFKCTSLKSITIPASVKSIGEGVLFACDSLSTIQVAASNPYFDSRNGCNAIIATATNTLLVGCKNTIIPNTVTRIKSRAFDSDIVKSITLPSSVTAIDESAFGLALKSFTIHVPSESLAQFKAMESLAEYKIVGDAKSTPKQPPLLMFVPNSLLLAESTPNQAIDANEQCEIRFQITNKGKGPAAQCTAKVRGTGSLSGLTFTDLQLPTIATGASYLVKIPVTSNLNTTDGTVTFTLEVTEPSGFGIDPMTLVVNTRSFDAPMLKIVDYAVSGNGTIQKKQPFDLQVLLQNTKYGKAEDVDVTLSVPYGVSLWEGEEKTHFTAINGGQQQKLNYQLAISGNYTGTTVPVQLTIKEKYGKFAENKTINLALNQQLASATSVTLQGQQAPVQRDAIAIGALGSAVDKNIPISQLSNSNTFAFIISNENYQQVSSVPMALNDGLVFKQYCQKTLGLLSENIKYYPNATLGNMAAAVQRAKDIANAYKGNLNILFYYAGHGIPDVKTKDAFLLPVDASGNQTAYCYSIDRLYRELGSTNAQKIVILLDACFSGSERGEGMLASVRSVALEAKSGVPQGNMVVMSAATGDQTAFPYEAEGHGMFTYFLLKKLQATGGDVTLLDLFNYVHQQVSQKTSVTSKLQTPTIAASATLGDSWKNWKLK